MNEDASDSDTCARPKLPMTDSEVSVHDWPPARFMVTWEALLLARTLTLVCRLAAESKSSVALPPVPR
ncbi:hypothetical protein D3C72_2597880 [compost metagenome]